MSNASKSMHIRMLGLTSALVALLVFSPAALAQTAPSFSEVPDPPTRPLAVAAETPDSYVSEGSTQVSALSPEEVIRMLQEGNEGKPLTISQLAAINDAMQRMEYVAEMRRKMNESAGGAGGFAGAAGGAGVAGRGGAAGGVAASLASGIPTVMRISGSSGNYQALVTNGQQQFVVREGDSIGSSKVTSITLSGVRVSSDAGSSSVLPFVSPNGPGVFSSSR